MKVFTLLPTLGHTAVPWAPTTMLRMFSFFYFFRVCFCWTLTSPYNSIRRGYQVYREVCSACHSLDRIAWRNLIGVSHTEAEVKAMAEEFEYQDGPDENGEMFMRPGKVINNSHWRIYAIPLRHTHMLCTRCSLPITCPNPTPTKKLLVQVTLVLCPQIFPWSPRLVTVEVYVLYI